MSHIWGAWYLWDISLDLYGEPCTDLECQKLATGVIKRESSIKLSTPFHLPTCFLFLHNWYTCHRGPPSTSPPPLITS